VPVPTFGGGLVERGATDGKAGLGKAQEDEAEDWAGVLLGGQAGVGAEIISGIPKLFFQRIAGGVLFRWGNPVHEAGGNRKPWRSFRKYK
jgi:hypothetical protein